MALGADRGRILRGVLRETMGLAAAGIGVGVVAAAAAASAIQNRLYGLKATDPLTVCLAAGLLCAVALCAAFLPARRAAGTDPLLALRAD
jgi:ABC-type antimicrobial peptide transport system permease subunit